MNPLVRKRSNPTLVLLYILLTGVILAVSVTDCSIRIYNYRYGCESWKN